MQVKHYHQLVTFLQAFYYVVPEESHLVAAASVLPFHSIVELTQL